MTNTYSSLKFNCGCCDEEVTIELNDTIEVVIDDGEVFNLVGKYHGSNDDVLWLDIEGVGAPEGKDCSCIAIPWAIVAGVNEMEEAAPVFHM